MKEAAFKIKGEIMREKILLVTLNEKYIEFLYEIDKKVSLKKNRIWIGVIFEINDFKYFAPMSSPKEKHIKMKEQIDFLKINDGKLGVINYNNMVPVINKKSYELINIEKQKDIKYKKLLIQQQIWLRKNKKLIYLKSEILYKEIEKILSKKYRNKKDKLLLKRCVNFKKIENKLIEK